MFSSWHWAVQFWWCHSDLSDPELGVSAMVAQKSLSLTAGCVFLGRLRGVTLTVGDYYLTKLCTKHTLLFNTHTHTHTCPERERCQECFCFGPNCKCTGHTPTDNAEVFTLRIMRTVCVHNYDNGKYKGMIILTLSNA